MCSSGRYLDVEGKTLDTDCQLCEKGKYIMHTGDDAAHKCDLCPTGRYGPSSGLSSGDGIQGVCSMLQKDGQP